MWSAIGESKLILQNQGNLWAPTPKEPSQTQKISSPFRLHPQVHIQPIQELSTILQAPFEWDDQHQTSPRLLYWLVLLKENLGAVHHRSRALPWCLIGVAKCWRIERALYNLDWAPVDPDDIYPLIEKVCLAPSYFTTSSITMRGWSPKWIPRIHPQSNNSKWTNAKLAVLNPTIYKLSISPQRR